jgi:hypothetical protein
MAEDCLCQRGMKPTVVSQGNPLDLYPLTLTHQRPRPPRCVALEPRPADVSRARLSSLPSRVQDREEEVVAQASWRGDDYQGTPPPEKLASVRS